jgi:hypothetical protein
MLVVGRLSDRTPLLGLACAIGPTSLPSPLNVSPISKASSYLLVYRTLNSATAMSPRTPSSCTASSSFLSICAPYLHISLLPIVRLTCVSRSLLLQSYLLCAHLRCRARCSSLLVLVVPLRASGRSPPSQGHPRARLVLV